MILKASNIGSLSHQPGQAWILCSIDRPISVTNYDSMNFYGREGACSRVNDLMNGIPVSSLVPIYGL